MEAFEDAYARYAEHDPTGVQPFPQRREWHRHNILASSLPQAPIRYTSDDGEKFPGGYGPTSVLWTDYWTLRARSSDLFERNLYARGLIRRLITNEINVGLHLEATPEERILGLEEDALADWAEDVENRFAIWGADGELCDAAMRASFGELQAEARREALISGDVLVVLRQDARTHLPRVQLVRGDAVQTPLFNDARFNQRLPNGNRIVHGVEIDEAGRHVAFWIRQHTNSDPLALKSQRLPAVGPRSGKRIAWLVYGCDKRLEQTRGKPLLSLVLQSLNEIDKYRDSTQRKAALNSMYAMFVQKEVAAPGTRPLTGGAIRRGTEQAYDTTGTLRTFNVSEHIPGVIIDELQVGETPKAFPSTGTDEKFGDFEEAIIQAVAWANEVPPEILRLTFSNNYSASQAAINEFKIYLNPVRTHFGKNFCQPIYVEWLVSEVLAGRVDAPGFLDAWRQWALFDRLAAWTHADWSGHIKPAVDMSKLVVGYERQVKAGFITRDRASRELNGTKYSKNVQKLARENEQLAEALRPMLELEAELKAQSAPAPAEPAGRDAAQGATIRALPQRAT
jgi:lambda family phage portal protein